MTESTNHKSPYISLTCVGIYLILWPICIFQITPEDLLEYNFYDLYDYYIIRFSLFIAILFISIYNCYIQKKPSNFSIKIKKHLLNLEYLIIGIIAVTSTYILIYNNSYPRYFKLIPTNKYYLTILQILIFITIIYDYILSYILFLICCYLVLDCKNICKQIVTPTSELNTYSNAVTV